MSGGSYEYLRHSPVIVIGAGLTGLATALWLRKDYLLFEAEARPGGLARSERVQNFTFDRTGHWLHLQDPELKRIVKSWSSDPYLQVERISKVFANGVVTSYPFQVHLHGHPPEVVLDCLLGLWRLRDNRPKRAPKTFEDFIYTKFGDGIARHFLFPYNEKLWGVHPREMTVEWCKRFFPVPSIKQFLAGAVGAPLPEMGYNVHFMYPRSGGIESLVRDMVNQVNPNSLFTNSSVEVVDYKKHRVLVGGEWMKYKALVSTIPLPELCSKLSNAPTSVANAVEKLRWTSVLYLDLAVSTPTIPNYHWIYIPEKKYPFYRVGIYSNVASSMAPAGCSSLYVELASRDISKSLDEVLPEILHALIDIDVLKDTKEVCFARLNVIEYAYVIYDTHYVSARRFLLNFLKRYNIYSCGRFGSWTYNSMEDCLLEGRKLGQELSCMG